ncbi:hypothetical protein MCOR25_006969 [Pyricularia grisea]|uniref:Mitogen-activated protein kinase organizer 1 n=1 Tax=Pyricularia grisea TaxID=148305 RepID=A0A6P8BAN2_PYRGI|nr:uncharacterized protein PgNI_03391 [Pyricularia grisea]KAI6359702.1 hypothetical protein MCOR25_006969 [Pyricularia grisea]TLD12891.1 hypothetical protein PgNI_03391 [Pyricularia grisea]
MAFPGKPVSQLVGSNGPIHAVAYSASPGTYILTGSADRSIRLYNPQPTTSAADGSLPEGRLIQTYSAHGYEVLSLAVAGDNARFASSGGDRTVFLWDVATATTLRRFGNDGHTSRVNCVAFGGDGDSVLVSGGFDTTVKLWDCKGGGNGSKPIQTLTDSRDGISALAVRDAEVVTGSVDGRVRTYDVRMGRCVVDVVGPSVTSLCLSRDGNALLVGSLDSSLRLMDRAAGTCLRTYRAEGRWRNESLRVQSLLGAGERFVVTGDELSCDVGVDETADQDGKVWAWDLLTGEVVATLKVPWGAAANGVGERRRRAVGRDGKEKGRKNIMSCLAWREGGWGNQFCVGGSSGVVTVFGTG